MSATACTSCQVTCNCSPLGLLLLQVVAGALNHVLHAADARLHRRLKVPLNELAGCCRLYTAQEQGTSHCQHSSSKQRHKSDMVLVACGLQLVLQVALADVAVTERANTTAHLLDCADVTSFGARS